MNELLHNFIESLREELKQYGELLALLGVTSTREDAGITVERPRGFRMACVFGALAAIYRILAAADGATAAEAAQRDFYEKTYADVRRGVRGKVDGKLLLGGVAALTRA